MEQRDRHVAEGRHDLRRVAGSDARAIRTTGDSADRMRSVLTPPRPTHEVGASAGAGLRRRARRKHNDTLRRRGEVRQVGMVRGRRATWARKQSGSRRAPSGPCCCGYPCSSAGKRGGTPGRGVSHRGGEISNVCGLRRCDSEDHITLHRLHQGGIVHRDVHGISGGDAPGDWQTREPWPGQRDGWWSWCARASGAQDPDAQTCGTTSDEEPSPRRREPSRAPGSSAAATSVILCHPVPVYATGSTRMRGSRRRESDTRGQRNRQEPTRGARGHSAPDPTLPRRALHGIWVAQGKTHKVSCPQEHDVYI